MLNISAGGGVKLAIINCCEHEFSVADDSHHGANPLNAVGQYNAIKKSQDKADFVIIIVHGGSETFQLPSTRMQEMYRFFIDAGADCVVNHHQHCFSGYEIYRGKPIFYGLGNFCFDSFSDASKLSAWNFGFLLRLKLELSNIDFEIIPYKQCADKPEVVLLNREEKLKFNSVLINLNEIILDSNHLQNENNKWYSQHSSMYKEVVSPYMTRYGKSACRRGILPAFLSKRKALGLINAIECEAHRDRLVCYLKSFLTT